MKTKGNVVTTSVKSNSAPKGHWGQPLLYKEEYCERVNDFIKERVANNTIPTVVGFAIYLGHHKDTLYEWAKIYPNMSDSLKKITQVQEDMLISGVTNGKMNPAGAIFLLKNNHGYKDKIEKDITVGIKPIPILGGDAKQLEGEIIDDD